MLGWIDQTSWLHGAGCAGAMWSAADRQKPCGVQCVPAESIREMLRRLSQSLLRQNVLAVLCDPDMACAAKASLLAGHTCTSVCTHLLFAFLSCICSHTSQPVANTWPQCTCSSSELRFKLMLVLIVMLMMKLMLVLMLMLKLKLMLTLKLMLRLELMLTLLLVLIC